MSKILDNKSVFWSVKLPRSSFPNLSALFQPYLCFVRAPFLEMTWAFGRTFSPRSFSRLRSLDFLKSARTLHPVCRLADACLVYSCTCTGAGFQRARFLQTIACNYIGLDLALPLKLEYVLVSTKPRSAMTLCISNPCGRFPSSRLRVKRLLPQFSSMLHPHFVRLSLPLCACLRCQLSSRDSLPRSYRSATRLLE